MAAADAAVNVTITRSDDASYSGQYALRKKEDVIRIGRSPANNIKLEKIRGVSAYHAEIRLAESFFLGNADADAPVLSVRDLSMNGSGRQLPGSSEIVRLGKGIETTFVDGAVLVVPQMVKAGTEKKTSEDQRVFITLRYKVHGTLLKATASTPAVSKSSDGDAVRSSADDGIIPVLDNQRAGALVTEGRAGSAAEADATPVPKAGMDKADPATIDKKESARDSSRLEEQSEASDSDKETVKTQTRSVSDSDDAAEGGAEGKGKLQESANIEFDPEASPKVESDFRPKLAYQRDISTDLPAVDDLLGPAKSMAPARQEEAASKVSDKEEFPPAPISAVAKRAPSPKKRKRSPSSSGSRGAQRGRRRGQDRSRSRSGTQSRSRSCSRSRSRSRRRRRGRRKRSRSRRGKRSRSGRSGRGRKRSRSRGRRDEEKSKASKRNGEASAQAGSAVPGMPPAWGGMPPGGQPGHHWQWGAAAGGPWAWNPAGGAMPGMQMPGMQAPWGGMQPGAGGTMSVEMCKQQIYWMYQRFRPEKLPEFENILKKYKGSEFDLLKAMCAKYFKSGTESAAPPPPPPPSVGST